MMYSTYRIIRISLRFIQTTWYLLARPNLTRCWRAHSRVINDGCTLYLFLRQYHPYEQLVLATAKDSDRF